MIDPALSKMRLNDWVDSIPMRFSAEALTINLTDPHQITMQESLDQQQFDNDYRLINGVEMHAENPDHFLIPPQVMKRQLGANQFVELRIDSTRFSVHEDDAAQCACPSCNGAMSNPILSHPHPASLVELPDENTPSRGWGEDFWVRIAERSGDVFSGVVDNDLVEARLHGIEKGSTIYFLADHVLAIHPIHRQELVSTMSLEDLKELASWLRMQPPPQDPPPQDPPEEPSWK